MAENQPIAIPPRMQDLTGKVFGRLTALHYAGNYQWLCSCSCGTIKRVAGSHLRAGSIVSCGCFQRECVAEMGRTRNRRHGESRHGRRELEWTAWSRMWQRCTNPKRKDWKHYGGRGVTVCERWATYENFLADMGRRPSSKHSIDRFPDTNGNYEPGNCRWATWTEQARNRRNNKLITHNGETRCLSEWAELHGLTTHQLYNRLASGWNFTAAVEKPLQRANLSVDQQRQLVVDREEGEQTFAVLGKRYGVSASRAYQIYRDWRRRNPLPYNP